jgi:hypothetical protein
MTTSTSIHSEIIHLFGPVEDHRIVEIMDLQPSGADLEVAAAYFAGMTDVMGDERQPLSGTAAKVYEIISRDEELLEE